MNDQERQAVLAYIERLTDDQLHQIVDAGFGGGRGPGPPFEWDSRDTAGAERIRRAMRKAI